MPSNVVDYQKINGQKTDWFIVLPAALQSTATRTSGNFNNLNASGMILTVVVGNEAGACSYTPSVATLDAFGGVITLWTAAAPITANGTYTYALSGTTFTNASFTQIAQLLLPRVWYVVLTYAGTPANDKMDTKVSACLI